MIPASCPSGSETIAYRDPPEGAAGRLDSLISGEQEFPVEAVDLFSGVDLKADGDPLPFFRLAPSGTIEAGESPVEVFRHDIQLV